MAALQSGFSDGAAVWLHRLQSNVYWAASSSTTLSRWSDKSTQAWGVSFSSPQASDLAPDSEAVAEGRAAGRRVCFSAPLVGEGRAVAEGRAVERGHAGWSRAAGKRVQLLLRWLYGKDSTSDREDALLYGRLCLTSAVKKPGMARCGPALTAFRRTGWPTGIGIEGT